MIRVDSDRFSDEHGRTLMLRGVNLGGSSKVPATPDGSTWRREGFFDHRNVSFVGRPFPLSEADEHFSRLAHWGFTFLRLLTTWEAVEHEGPGRFDVEYLNYLHEIVGTAAEHGISVFIDPHQDCWSRFSGGDGAPGWTFEACGLDMTRFAETGAAITHQEHGDPFPRMIWPTNYGKLANLTMWTLFFGGNDFAPRMHVDGIPVQSYLQKHYIRAMQQVAHRLRDLPNVVGFDTLNEPSAGLIGMRDFTRNDATPLKIGPSPTPLQAMALGAGVPQDVAVYRLGLTGMRRMSTQTLNAGGARVWATGVEGIWRQHDVWDVDGDGVAYTLRPGYFFRVGEHEVNFAHDYYQPFVRRYAAAIREAMPEAVIFLEGPPNTRSSVRPGGLDNAAYAGHWYDAYTLLRKHHSPWLGIDAFSNRLVFGRARVARSFNEQIGSIITAAREEMGGLPTVIGEVGIPFDLDGKRAYRTGDFRAQIRALDTTMRALEANRASFTLWNYTADNTNEHGDRWNGEDLSIFSRDQMTGTGSPDDGGRALRAAVRPYAMAVPGAPLRMSFDIRTRIFEFDFRPDGQCVAPAEFFVPELQYPDGFEVEAPLGSVKIEGQRVFYTPGPGPGAHELRIAPAAATPQDRTTDTLNLSGSASVAATTAPSDSSQA